MSSEGQRGVAEHLSAQTADFVCQAIGEMLILLGAPRTLVEVASDPEPEGAWASVDAHSQKHLMTVSLCPEWETRHWVANGRTMLHESIHYLHAGQDRILVDVIQPRLYNHDWWNVARDEMQRQYELFVDQLTETLWEALQMERRLKQLHKQLGYPRVKGPTG